MPITRSIKNVVHNYTDAERKVREATSNDPWGPDSTLMSEIADKTHNVLAFTEIMEMIWRRLQDRQKLWRHVYKALVLLEYIIKTGSDNVASQCREHITFLDSLQYFEYTEDGKDHGVIVREKAHIVTCLLREPDRLSEERAKAWQARSRVHGFSSSPQDSPRRSAPLYSSHSGLPPPSATELDSARPSSVGEEQLQLQLAMAISKEEHERDERRRRTEADKEEVKIQMALEQSRREKEEAMINMRASSNNNNAPSSPGGGLFESVDTRLSAAPAHLADPWGASQPPLAASSKPAPATGSIPIDDPWYAPAASSQVPLQPSAADSSQPAWNTFDDSLPPFVAQQPLNTPLSATSPVEQVPASGNQTDATTGDVDDGKQDATVKRTPLDFLGEHGGLVNLDNLIDSNPASTNPFAIAAHPARGAPSNPFTSTTPRSVQPLTGKPSLNQLGSGQSSQVPHFYAAATSPTGGPANQNWSATAPGNPQQQSSNPLNPFV